MPIEVTAEELGGLLFSIHEHGKVAGEKGNQIVYKESDIIKLLTKLGYPLPVWGKVIRIDEFNPVPYPRG